MAARDTSKTNTPVDSGEPTTSTSETDASTTAGQEALGTTAPTPPAETSAPTTAEQPESVGTTTADPQRVQVEIKQPEPAPAVFYGDGGIVPGSGAATDPNREHVKAEYAPFEW